MTRPTGQPNSKRSSRNRRRKKSGAKKPVETMQPSAPVKAEPSLPKAPDLPLRRYGVLFFETFKEAKSKIGEVEEAALAVDQLNIVIHADGDMDDPELCEFGKVFAGEAWTLIHRRRVDDGWYNEPHAP